MADDASDMMSKFSEFLGNKDNIPDNIKEILGSLNNSNSSSPNSSPNISPEMMSNFMNMLNKNNFNDEEKRENEKSENTETNSFNNIDMGTIMKMKAIMDKMNSKDDPRSNLLYSLKPYLNDRRKGKLDQYVQLFNVTKVIDVFGNNGGGKDK